MQSSLKQSRFALVATAMFILLAAMWAGLYRMGWQIPALQPMLSGVHGPLMVSGFLGTLIGMERAVGLRLGWAFTGPVLTGVGALALVFGAPITPCALLITLGSLNMIVVFTYITRHQALIHNVCLLIAACAWFVGNLLWLFGQPISVVVGWWAGYLILTIAGERLELTRLIQISARQRALFLAVTALYLAGCTVLVFDYTLGWRITGLGMVALAAWLLMNDIARRTVRQEGLTRFIAVCMLSGYVWLGAGGLIAIRYGFLAGGLYDAALHSVFLGFVMTMIFGHAPVIFPAVLSIPIPYRPAFYAHLVLLHLSLLLRVGSDLLDWHGGQLWAVMFNVIALLLFLGNTVAAARSKRKR